MANRKRNFFILLAVVGLLAGSAVAILNKPTRLGLDLKGGVELIYEARPTPKVPEVTPQAIDDAIETIGKRTNSLGVSEPEIQRSGANQISVGLPDVEDAERAIRQVGTTAQLQFYDWEPNVIGPDGKPDPDSGAADTPVGLFEAVQTASKAKAAAEPEDIPPEGAAQSVVQEAGGDQAKIQAGQDLLNDSRTGAAFYLFNANRQLIAGPVASCDELATDAGNQVGKIPPAGARTEFKAGAVCAAELNEAGAQAFGKGSRVFEIPRGVVVVRAPRPDSLAPEAPFDQFHVLEDDSELTGADIQNPEQSFDPQTQEPVVTMEFTDKGRNAFAAVTKRIAQRGSAQIPDPGLPPDSTFQRFAITLDNEVVSLATIDFIENPEGIDGRTGAQITGIGSIEATQDLAESLRIGALPIELKLISNTKVSATLGKQALDQGLIAAGAGLVLTLLFLIVFYRVLGLIAGVALVTYAVFLFALVELIPITLTLPGIAGLILTLGVAADANIVVFERIKEEARTGRSIPAAIAAGYTKALRTIIDANVVTIGVAFILFVLATAGVKGFAFTLGVGTLVSLFTAVLATSAMLGAMSRTRLLGSRFALGAGKDRKGSRFDFMGSSKYFFSMSGAILAVGAIAISIFGINFGIDFESGTRVKTPLEQPATVDQVREAVTPLGFGDAEIQAVEEPDLGANVVQISFPTLAPDQVQRVQSVLDERFGVNTADFSNNSIGPTFGAQVATTAVIAIIASLLLISLYIGLRFEFKFAVPVLIALAHDLLITAGVYALLEREVTTSTVAALLTILGYSLYDTIIVFDRIRENVPRMPRATFSQIVNRSMSEVIIRSLVTSLCTLFPIAALMFFGGETLRDFGFALLVGVASGTYSSIFIASPVLTAWKERESRYRRVRRLVEEDHDGVVPAYAETSLGTENGDESSLKPGRRPARKPAAPSARSGTGARRAGAGTAVKEPPATEAGTAVELPPDGEVEAATPSTAPEPAPKPRAKTPARTAGNGGRTSSTGGGRAKRVAPKGDGDGAGDGAGSPGGEAAGEREAKAKAAANRRRKKHGRR